MKELGKVSKERVTRKEAGGKLQGPPEDAS